MEQVTLSASRIDSFCAAVLMPPFRFTTSLCMLLPNTEIMPSENDPSAKDPSAKDPSADDPSAKDPCAPRVGLLSHLSHQQAARNTSRTQGSAHTQGTQD